MLTPRPPSATRSRSSTDQVGCPTWTGHLAPALLELAERTATGIFHVAGGGRAPGTSCASSLRRRPGVDCRVLPDDEPRVRAAPRRARRTACSAPSARDAVALPPWQEGVPAYLAALEEIAPHEAARLRRRRVHRLHLRPPARARRTATRSSCSTSSPTPAGARTCRTCDDRARRTARSRTPTPSRARSTGVRRDRQLRRRDARRPLDRRARRVRQAPTRTGTYVLLEAARERGVRYVQVSTDEVYGSIEEGSFTEESPLHAVLALQRDEGRRRPARRRLLPHLRPRGADLPRLEQLRAVPVPREADPADGPQRDARRPAAGLRRRHAGAQLDLRRATSRAASATCSSTACPARPTTSAAPTSAPNIEVVKRIIELTGADESLIEYVTDRPGHDRRYSLGSDKVRALGWEPQVRFAEGLERTVDWYRDNAWWWEPIRSGDYRAYYERQYGRVAGLSARRSTRARRSSSGRRPCASVKRVVGVFVAFESTDARWRCSPVTLTRLHRQVERRRRRSSASLTRRVAVALAAARSVAIERGGSRSVQILPSSDLLRRGRRGRRRSRRRPS